MRSYATANLAGILPASTASPSVVAAVDALLVSVLRRVAAHVDPALRLLARSELLRVHLLAALATGGLKLGVDRGEARKGKQDGKGDFRHGSSLPRSVAETRRSSPARAGPRRRGARSGSRA